VFMCFSFGVFFFFFNDTATTEIYTLSLHDALPISTAATSAAVASAVLSGILKFVAPTLPFMDRVGVVFLACLGLAVLLSMLERPREAALQVDLKNIDYSTGAGFNIAAALVAVILLALYTVWW